MSTRLEASDLLAINGLAELVVLAMTKDELREFLDRLGDLPEVFDDLIGALDEAMAAATEAKPAIVVIRVAR
jgi:hypothetical protein